MQTRSLFIALAFLSVSLFSINAIAYYYENSDDSYGEPTFSSNEDYDGNSYDNSEYADGGSYGTRYSYYQSDEPVTRHYYRHQSHHLSSYYSRLSQQISCNGERVIIVDPRVHAWGAYSEDGRLIHAGLASAGSGWCHDLGRPCRTRSGTFRIHSLGDSDCFSKKFPLGEGGAPMPYCMYFNGGQGIHGSYELAEGNISHGCVRISVSDAYWLRFNFAHIGTKIIIRPY